MSNESLSGGFAMRGSKSGLRTFQRSMGRLLLLVCLSCPAQAQDITDVRVALAWLRNGQYGALMLADTQGFFAKEGIRVTFMNGGPGKNPVPIVAAGQAQFGVTRGSDIFTSRVAPTPVDIVAVGALVQKDPVVYLTLADPSTPPPIPKDMEGKKVGVQPGSDFVLRAMAQKNNIDFDRIKLVTVGAGAEPLLVGQVDYLTSIATNQVYQVEEELKKADAPSYLRGKVLRKISLYDVGVPTYQDVLFTSAKILNSDPHLVERFVRAVALGAQYMVDHPEEAAKIIAGYPDQIEDNAKLSWRFGVQRELTVSADTLEHGYLWMNPAIWTASMELYQRAGQISRTSPPEEYMTNRFNPGLKSTCE